MMGTVQSAEELKAPGYYVWFVPGKTVSVRISLDMVDRLSSEVMTGFGAIPRRGAEVGGILMGTIEAAVVTIDDFVPVPCEHKRGPSYLLSEADAAAFEAAYERCRPAPGKTQYAVGYYRSNTRDQTSLADEDRAICARYFAAPDNVVLFIKPYASKVSTAGFITYEDGRLEDHSALEFPFRRNEMEGSAPPKRRPFTERIPRPEPVAQRMLEARDHDEPPRPPDNPVLTPATAAPANSRSKGWFWIPLSILALLVGILAGLQTALMMSPQTGAPIEDPYAIGLSVSQSGDNLHVQWNRDAQPIRSARRAALEIKDGNYTRTVDLDVTQIQNGSVIYRRLTKNVTFRLEVFPQDHVGVSQTLNWNEAPQLTGGR
jgi:hypothetical protein